MTISEGRHANIPEKNYLRIIRFSTDWNWGQATAVDAAKGVDSVVQVSLLKIGSRVLVVGNRM